MMWFIAVLFVAFFGGLVLTLDLSARTSAGAALALLVGFGLALGLALLFGVFVPNTYPDDGGEPIFTRRGAAEFCVAVGFVLWLLGVAVGAAVAAIRRALARRRRRSVEM